MHGLYMHNEAASAECDDEAMHGYPLA